MKLLSALATTALCVVLYSPPSVAAQSSTSSSVNSSQMGESAVQLSEFTVNENSDHGYIASESVTGTRVATKIKDLPFSVSVITSEFMRDFDFFDIGKDMVYTASLSNVDSQGNSSLRGFGATFTLRNGFYRLGLVDRVNIDRIEVIKGPNAAIYGSTSPAGLINYVSATPKYRNFERVTLTAGSLDFARAELTVNNNLGSLGSVKFAQLINLAGNNLGSETQFGATRNRLIGYSLLSTFHDGSTLNFEFEWSRKREVTSTSQLPYEYNTATRTYSSVKRRDLAYFSQGGPDSTQNRELSSFYLTYDKRYNQTWSTHAGGYYYRRHAFNFNNSSSDAFDPVTNRFNRSTNVLVDPLNEEGGGVQIDTLADYHLFHDKIQAKTLFTIDDSENWRYRQQTGVNTRLWTINTPSIINTDYTLPPRSAFNVITRRDKVRWDIQGFLLRQQLTALNGRLLGFGSLRRDSVTYNFTFGNQYSRAGGALATPGMVAHYTDRAWSPNFGFNYKLTPNIALYASHSQSFSPQGQVARLGDPHLANETSVGWDYGIKASYLQERLIFTLGGYYIDRYGVKTTRIDPLTGLSETVSAGTQLARGIEFEGSFRVTDDFFLQASYSRVNAVIVYNGTAVSDVGQPPAGLPKDQGSLVTKYSFRRGLLKGVSWNAGVVYSGAAYPNSTAALNDARRNTAAASYVVVNTGVTYTWRQDAQHLSHTVRLSAKNALDREYETSRGQLGDQRGIYIAYTLNH